MSNFLAIATVTASLRKTLQGAVGADVPGATVTTARPDSPENGTPGARVNIYLFQVTPNAAWRNADLPTRRPNGELVQRPRVALDLHYLLTFYGNETQLEPQRMLGSAVRAVHSRPVLTRQMIRDTIIDPELGFLARSNLADEIELVKFTPGALSLEELSKLWSVFLQTPYHLSVVYQGTLVLIESEESPRATLPVRFRNVYVVPFRHPTIEQVMPAEGAGQPVLADSTLLIQGKQLRGEITQVRIAGQIVRVPAQEVSDTQLNLDLASLLAEVLRAGVQGVQVVHDIPMSGLPPRPEDNFPGVPPVGHKGFESNVAAFVLRPTIKKNSDEEYEIDVSDVKVDPVDGKSYVEVTAKLDPHVGKAQRVALLLNEFDAPEGRSARAYSFDAKSRSEPTDPESSETIVVKIPIEKVKPAEYLVRLQVDGAETIMDADRVTGEFTEPRIDLRVEPTPGPIPIPGTSMRVKKIIPSSRRDGNAVTVEAKVFVVDENDRPVAGADVSATWTRPQGPANPVQDRTNTEGIARFNTSGGAGTYTLQIISITKTAFVFDPENSILSKSINASGTALRVTRIGLSGEEKNGAFNVRAKIFVQDENRNKIKDAMVSISWKLPDGRTENKSAETIATGIASFLVRNGQGTYEVAVTNVEASGFTFDRDRSELSNSITV